MRKLLAFLLTVTVISGMLVMPSFATTAGNITWISNEYEWGYSEAIQSNKTAFNISPTDGLVYKAFIPPIESDYEYATFILDSTTSIVQPKEEASNTSGTYEATGKNLLAKFSINKSADIYIGLSVKTEGIIDWLSEEGYEKVINEDGEDIYAFVDQGEGERFNLYKKTFIATETVPAEVSFYSTGVNTKRPCPIFINWKDTPELSSAYTFQGKSGEDGDDNVYTYVFSRISNAADGADYGVEAGGKWYSLVKDIQDKIEYNKALSSGYFAIGLADPDGILGPVYTITPQVRFNGNVITSGTEVTVDTREPEESSDATLKSISLTNTASGSNAVLTEDIIEGKYEYDLVYYDVTGLYSHTIIPETNDPNATVSVTNATSSNPVATVTVTAQDGESINTYTFNYKKLSDAGYSSYVSASQAQTASNKTFRDNCYSNVTSRAYIGNSKNGTAKAITVLSFDITELEGITSDAVVMINNRVNANAASMTLSVYGATRAITSEDTEYDTVNALKGTKLTSSNIYTSYTSKAKFVINIDKEYILEKLSKGETNLTLILESDTAFSGTAEGVMALYNVTGSTAASTPANLLYYKK